MTYAVLARAADTHGMMHHCPPHPLMQAIRSFDYTLQKPVLNRLSLEKMEAALEELADFHGVVTGWDAGEETPYLAAVGCRLGSDLNEALMTRLGERLQAQDAAVEELSARLKNLLQERHRTARLLMKTREIRQRTLETGERLGLGLVL